MSQQLSFRVLVRTGQIFAIRLAARDEAGAVARAERLWRAGRQSEFDCVHHRVAEEFDIDPDDEYRAPGECSNAHRARWAAAAIRTLARDTGAEMGEEAFSDLLCNLGHWADRNGIDYRTAFERAAETWAEEVAEELQS